MTDNSTSKQRYLGFLAAATVVIIWSTWLVASRAGATSSLTPFDLAAIRYGISACVALPFVVYFKPWKTMSVQQIFVVSALLGPVYILAVFFAFTNAPAAHGGVFMNGALPAMTLLISWVWLNQRAAKQQLAGVVLIITGSALAAADANSAAFSDAWRGDLLFLFAGALYAGYLVVGKQWAVTAMQLLLCSSVINAVLYLPIWYLWLPSGLAQTPQDQLIVQIIYQGLIATLVGLVLVAYAARHIGPSATSAFMAAVPAMGTLLGMVVLSEMPGLAGWLSLVILTPGILLVALYAQG